MAWKAPKPGFSFTVLVCTYLSTFLAWLFQFLYCCWLYLRLFLSISAMGLIDREGWMFSPVETLAGYEIPCNVWNKTLNPTRLNCGEIVGDVLLIVQDGDAWYSLPICQVPVWVWQLLGICRVSLHRQSPGWFPHLLRHFEALCSRILVTLYHDLLIFVTEKYNRLVQLCVDKTNVKI